MTATKTPRKRRAVDLPRVEAARAKLDDLVARYPHLTSPESQERLAKHLHNEAPKEGDDGSEEDDGG